MDVQVSKNDTMKQFLEKNTEQFKHTLLNEAANVKDKIDHIHNIGNINLIENAIILATYAIENQEDKAFAFAEKEGVIWAKFRITLAFKLEWVQAIRRSLWKFIEIYSNLTGEYKEHSEIFKLEKTINNLIDKFLNGFFLSYSNYKDEQLETQRNIVNNLSVPIIPITDTVCVLPLIGTIDSERTRILEEKVLVAIREKRISVLFVDLSGIHEISVDSMHVLSNIIDGIVMMGCKPILTGIQPEIVQTIIEYGIDLDQNSDTRATLQQALREYNVLKDEEKSPNHVLDSIFNV